MRTYSYQTTGVSTADQIAYRNSMIEKQNSLAISGGTPLPQFATAGIPVGPDNNLTIQKMAAVQSKMDAGNQFSECSGKAAGTCGGRRSKRSKRSKRSRQKKMKSKKKYHKI